MPTINRASPCRKQGTPLLRRTLLLLQLAVCSMVFAQTGARYLIITYDNYYNAVQPLAQWKTQKGMLARTVKLSDIGSSATQIHDYILNAWTNWTIKPEYVLLVGDPSVLPVSQTSPGDGSDDHYGDMTGNYEVEIPVGRLFCTTLAECSLLVYKSLTYEKRPFADGDSTWMHKGTTIIREDAPPDQYYAADSRYIRGLWTNAGYLVTESLNSAYGSTSTDVRNAIIAGRGFVVHRGQCVGNWWSPFDQVSPGTLTNGNKLPVVVSGSCQTMTLLSGSTMLADQFVRAGTVAVPRGAVAYFGTTSIGSHISLQRGTVTKGFFTAVFAEGRYKLGDACKRGKFYLDSLVPGNTQYYQEWNLLGDPELPLWTEQPKPLAATYDSLLPLGDANLNIHVTRGGGSLAGAVVCAMMDSTVYTSGTTDSAGNLTLPIHTVHLGPLTVTVTARNSLYYQGFVTIIAGNAPWLTFRRCGVDDSQGGNGNGLVNPGETIRLNVYLTNSGDSTAFGVTAGLDANDTFATVQDSLAGFGSVAPGDSAASLTPYTLHVSPACTCGMALGLTLHIRDNQGRFWQSPLSLPVYSASVHYNTYLINDPPPGGNGDGIMDPHESAELLVNLGNTGTDALYGVSATLRTTSAYISITDSTGTFGDIGPGSTATNSDDRFAWTTSPNLPSTPATFTLVIRGDGGTYSYRRTEQFVIVPAAARGPIGPDPYGYYCYDDGDTASGQAPAFSWLEIGPGGPGQLIPGITNSDAGLDTLALPFPFKYYGTTFETITVASNGFAAFGKTGARGASNSHIPSADSAQYRNLMPMWDDMNPSSAGNGDCYMYYDAANHRWIEEFYQVSHYWSQTTQETFQLILLDPSYYPTPTGDGDVLMVYDSVGNPNYATVGIQDCTWSRAIQYEDNGVYDPDAAPIVNRRVLRFTTWPPAPTSHDWLTLTGVAIDDSAGGNNNHIAEPGEVIRLTLTLRNLGDSAARATQAVLRSGDGNTTTQDSVAAFGDIPGQGQATNSAHPYIFQVAASPSDTLARFALATHTATTSSVIYFTIPLGSVVGVGDQGALAVHRLALSACPNPGRGSTMLRLALPAPGPVDLTICDATGRRVRTLVHGTLPAGARELRWDGRDEIGRSVSSGVYFLKLTTGANQRLIRKVAILR